MKFLRILMIVLLLGGTAHAQLVSGGGGGGGGGGGSFTPPDGSTRATRSNVVFVPTSIVAKVPMPMSARSRVGQRRGAGPHEGDEPLPRQICTSWWVSGFWTKRPPRFET